MLLEDLESARAMFTKKYAHCPLKKRPVLVREERPPTPPTSPPNSAHTSSRLYSDYQCQPENDEPQNLSTKPEDLSKTGNYPNKASSPVATTSFKLEPSEWPQHFEYFAVCQAQMEHISNDLVRPIPQYRHVPPLYMNTPNCAFDEPYPTATKLPSGIVQSTRTYGSRSYSPPLSCSSPPYPEDLRSPESVSSDSGVSVSAPRRPRYQCPDCAKSYSTYSGLSKHQQYHCAAAEGNLARKSFSCKYCAKVYTSLGALKMHIRTHTLPCKCHLCGKAFSRPWLLQGHIRTHTGEKPFSCHHCRRAFADRSNLRAHLQTHSDVKKYSCTSCGKTFSRMSLLSKHSEGGCGTPSPPLYEYRAETLPAAHIQPLPSTAPVHAY